MNKWFAYVPGSMVEEYEAQGWMLVDTGFVAHHDAYSAMMVWSGDEMPQFRLPMEERLTASHRLKAAFDECDLLREGDEAAFREALTALGMVAWNLRVQIEGTLC